MNRIDIKEGKSLQDMNKRELDKWLLQAIDVLRMYSVSERIDFMSINYFELAEELKRIKEERKKRARWILFSKWYCRMEDTEMDYSIPIPEIGDLSFNDLRKLTKLNETHVNCILIYEETLNEHYYQIFTK